MRPCVVLSELRPFVGSIEAERPETDREDAYYLVLEASGRKKWWPEYMVCAWDTIEEAEHQVAELKDNMRAVRRYL